MKKKPATKTVADTHLGIDLAKDKFDAVLRTGAGTLHHEVFPNNSSGLKALGRWLSTHRAGKVICVMEATGIYWEEAAAWLHGRAHTVHVLNPAQARRFAQSQLCRNKTDAVDAALLCRMALISRECALTVWQPPSEAVKILRGLTRGRAALVAQRAALRQQARECPERAVGDALQAVVRTLDAQIRRLEQRMRAHVAACPLLQEDVQLLDSLPGIDFISAAAIRAELATLHGADVRQTVAYAGLNPRQWQSGKNTGARSRMSKTGNARLRAILYLPALCGGRFNPVLRRFAARLLAGGKSKMQVVGALMHKTLALACGVLKTRQPFDPLWLAPQTLAA